MTQNAETVRTLDGTEISMPIGSIQFGYDFTDADLNRFRGNTQLILLDLTESRITDAGLKVIPSMPRLERLYVTSVVRITDTGLRYVTKCRSLKELCILDTSATDEGMRYLKDLKLLESLRIGSPDISGTGLVHLNDIKTLCYLSLSVDFNDANEKRIDDLKNGNPNLTISW